MFVMDTLIVILIDVLITVTDAVMTWRSTSHFPPSFLATIIIFHLLSNHGACYKDNVKNETNR